MVFEFGEFQLDTRTRELRGGTGHVSLEPKCFALLCLLIEHRERALSREEIFEAVWPGLFVTEASLSTAVRQIRTALGDTGQTQRFVKTIRGYGFRFVAEVAQRETEHSAKIDGNRQPPSDSSDLRAGKPTVAIRPFQLVGADAAQQAIAEAIPAELIATLSRLRSIHVIARGSSFRFGSSNSDAEAMGASLGARYVVAGVVEWMHRDVAIYAELSDSLSGQVVWSDRFAGAFDDIYELRSRVARDLTIALEVRLPIHEVERLAHQPSDSLDAWGHYHLGIRHMYRYHRDDNRIAAAHFQKAIDIDRSFARAYGGLSYTEFQNAFQHFETDTARHRGLALSHAEEAMRLDALDPFCNLIYGRAKWLSGEAEDGLIWVDRSIDLNPNYAFGYYNNATLNTVLCNGPLADQNVERALTLSPMDPHLQSMYGTRALAAFVSDDLDSATQFSTRALNAPNPHLYVYMIAAAVFSKSGAHDRAAQCVTAIRAKQVPFGKSDFLAHFRLRDPARLTALSEVLSGLDI